MAYLLAYPIRTGQLCAQSNKRNMRPYFLTSTLFEHFTALLNEEHVYMDRNLTFRDICRRMHVSPVDMDEILLNELGMDGESVLASYRQELQDVRTAAPDDGRSHCSHQDNQQQDDGADS